VPSQVVVPALTTGAALLALHKVLSQLKEQLPPCSTVAIMLGELLDTQHGYLLQ
jgi:hypothetical protein